MTFPHLLNGSNNLFDDRVNLGPVFPEAGPLQSNQPIHAPNRQLVADDLDIDAHRNSLQEPLRPSFRLTVA
jgi:hypothetical protein